MQTKLTVVALIGAILLVGAVFILSRGSARSTNSVYIGRDTSANIGAAIVENGIQYIDITARGGYTPRITKAKADIPTVIRMKTENTFDCSTALVIPDIGFQAYLERSGVKEIAVPIEKATGTLRGTCSMGMYNFQIDFE